MFNLSQSTATGAYTFKMKLLSLILITIYANTLLANPIQPYVAKYEISRGGKVTGEQTTTLKKTGKNSWTLRDEIVGTSGMASIIGFKRTEITQFNFRDGLLFATSHQMSQKAAFSKKKYQFKWQPDQAKYQINHKGKESSYNPDGKNTISSQLMPMALALAACQKTKQTELMVLKNKTAKPYSFKLSLGENMMAERVYQPNQNKTSRTWLDPTRSCLPWKQSHQDDNDPVIVTELIEFKWL